MGFQRNGSDAGYTSKENGSLTSSDNYFSCNEAVPVNHPGFCGGKDFPKQMPLLSTKELRERLQGDTHLDALALDFRWSLEQKAEAAEDCWGLG